MPATPRLETLPTEISCSIGYLLFRCNALSYRSVNAELAPLGIEVKQFAILCSLQTGGPKSQGWLGEHLGIDRTTMVQFVDGLEAKGLVERQRNPADRRSYALTITPEGVDTWRQARDGVARSESAVLETLEEEDRETLRRLLGQIAQGNELPLPDVSASAG
jgi:DNA-binding MarR family transcriptional regulator